MDAVFARDSGSLFPSDPLPKTFYCPTTPRRLSRHEQMTTLTPTHPPTTHTPPHKLHWDIVCTSISSAVGTSDTVLSTSGSSRFNESWPSNSEVEGVSTRDGSGNSMSVVSIGGNKEETKNEEMTGSQGTLAKYIERFRRAPPTSRNTRDTPSRPFWWKQNHVTSPGDHVTPPREPQDHSTPDSQKTASYTEPSPRVSTDTSRRPDPDGSLEIRSQELIDKSSSLLSGGSNASSMPAQKYFNTQSDRTQETVHSVRVTGASLQGTSLCPGALLDPSEDILYRWRLKRKLELARREAAMVNTESKQFHTTTSSSLTVPPHSHRSCDILPCTRRENQHQFDSYRNNETSESRTYVSTNKPVTATRCAHHTRDHPLQTCHSSLLEPTSNCVGTCDKIRTEGDVPNPVSPCQPDSGQSSSLHSRSGKRLKKELRSSIKRLSNDGHIGPDQAKIPTNGCNSQPVVSEPQVPSTVRTAAVDPPSPPCHRDVEEEDDDNDISLSNFSLNFTTEIDQTPQTNKEGQGTRTKGNMGPVVSQVVRNRLFGTPLSSSVTSTPPHTAVPLYTASSSDETISKAKVATSEVVEGREAPEIPWDCHMDDDLLKMLIIKAKLFEEQINNIDGLLSAMATY